MPEEDQDHQADDDEFLDEGMLQVVHGSVDELGTIVDGHHAQSLGQRGPEQRDLLLHPLDHLLGVFSHAHNDHAADGFATAIEIGDSAALGWSVVDCGHVAHANRGAAAGVVEQDDVSNVVERVQIASPAHHVFTAAEFHEASADIVVGFADGVGNGVDRNLIGLQADGVDLHLVLADEAADRGDLGDSGQRLQGVAHIPVLVAAHLLQTVLACVIDQSVLIDPADAGCVLGQLHGGFFGQSRGDGIEIFEGSRARPVKVGALVEDDVDIGDSEIGEAANVFHLGHSQQGRGDGIGELVLDDVGTAVPLGVDDDLGVAEVGDRIDFGVAHGAVAEHGSHGDQNQYQALVTRAEFDDRPGHLAPPMSIPGMLVPLVFAPPVLVPPGFVPLMPMGAFN